MSQQQKFITFYTLLLTQAFSLLGSQMTSIALGVWIFTTTGNATPLTLVSFFGFLPRLLSAGIAGVAADRFDRRYVMALADAGQAIGTVALLIAFATGTFQLWMLYVVAAIQATFGMFQAPAFQASVTMLVPDKHRNRANAVQLVTSPLAGIIAPTFAAALYAIVGVTGIIAIDLFTFAVSFIVLMVIRIPRPELSAESQEIEGNGGKRRSIWRDSLGGFQFVWARKPLFMVFVFTGLTNFFLAGTMSLNTPYILSRFSDRPNAETILGILLSVYSIGSLTGTLLMATWGGTRIRTHTMMPGIATTGLALAFLGTRTEPLAMAAALFVMALFPPMNNVCIISILQAKVPPDLQGRVFAAIMQMSMTLIPLSYLVAGPLADRVFEPAAQAVNGWPFAALVSSGSGAGIGLMMVISGLSIAIVAFSIFAIPWVRSLETSLPDYAPTPQPAVSQSN